MIKHYIIMSSSYTDGSRVALDITEDCFLNSKAIAEMIEEIRKNAAPRSTMKKTDRNRPLFFVISRIKSFRNALIIHLPFYLFHRRRVLICFHARHFSVSDFNHAVRHRCQRRVVSDDNDRHPLLPAGILQQL